MKFLKSHYIFESNSQDKSFYNSKNLPNILIYNK